MAKLSKEAAKRKAVRDKKAAMTPARRKKKAENQRRRRVAANEYGKSWLNGKDYDHDDKRFESIKANRGNDGNGTKKESNKNTKKINQMAKKKKSPVKNELPKTLFGTLIYEGQKAFKNSKGITETSAEANNRINERGKYAKKKSSGASNLDFSKGDIIGQYGKGKSKSKTSNASDGIMIRNAGTNTKPKTVKPSSNTNTSTKSKPVVKTKPAAKPIRSSDSDKGTGYFNDKLSLGVDTKINVAPMPKFERTVTNARSADYNLIRAKGRGKIDKLKSRLDRREARTANRVDRSVERIKSRQRRSGDRYASKMEARTNTGTNPGYFDSQKKLDAFEKSMDSPKATPRTSGAGNISSGSKPGQLRMPATNVTGQKAAKPSIKLKPTMSKTQTLTDSQLNKKLNKPAVKKKTVGKTKSLSMTRGERQQSLTDLAMTGKK